ncbi:hypothetical protein DL93DRAFT_2162675 [Clavulina sp. PMI_390]|nr:hypothetical protein DL93DRAFT_2162675 [Clavulina sp. PMI_390]
MFSAHQQLPISQSSETAIHHLPDELMADIFTRLLPYRRQPGAGAWQVTTTLASVCSLWRSIALSTPSLWSMIYFNDSKACSGSQEIISTQLQRSKSRPVDLVFRLDLYGIGLANTSLTVWKIIEPHISRCHSLAFQLTTTQDFFQIFPLPGNLPFLSSFRCNVGFSGLEHYGPYLLFEGEACSTPRLRELSLSCNFRALFNMDTSTLSTLDLDSTGGGWTDVSTALIPAKNLVHLRLAISVEHWEKKPDPLEFPCLKYLLYRGGRPSNRFHAPQLRKLVFEFHSSSTTCIEADFPCLVDLAMLEPSPADMEVIIDWLKSHPNIVRLELVNPAYLAVSCLADSLVEGQLPLANSLSSTPSLPEIHQESLKSSLLLPSLCLLEITSPYPELTYSEAGIDWRPLQRARPAIRVHHYGDTFDGPLVNLTAVERVVAQSLEWGWERVDPLAPERTILTHGSD